MRDERVKMAEVIIPEMTCRYGYCCADCVYMSRSDYNRYGEAYCGSYGKYYDPSDSACSRFVAR